MTTPSKILRAALVLMLEDMLREAEGRMEAAHQQCLTADTFAPEFADLYNKRSLLYKDTEALRRVIAMVKATPHPTR